MSEIKTLRNNADVREFIVSSTEGQKQQDSLKLLEIFTRLTGEKASMWGPSIVGFGQYHYKSQRSSQEGDWPLTGFSPRKQNLTIYIMNGFDNYDDLLSKLGKHKTSVSCLYIKKLSDIDVIVLEELITRSYKAMKKQYGINEG